MDGRRPVKGKMRVREMERTRSGRVVEPMKGKAMEEEKQSGMEPEIGGEPMLGDESRKKPQRGKRRRQGRAEQNRLKPFAGDM